MMKHSKTLAIVLAGVFLLAALAGCNGVKPAAAGSAAASAANASAAHGASAAPAQPSAGDAAQPSAAPQQAASGFSNDFKLLKANPLNEAVQAALYFASLQDDSATQPQQSLLQKQAERFKGIVQDKGVHFTQSMSMMGFDIKTEYWLKGGKFKKVEDDKVAIFDGESYVEYVPSEKKGTRYSKEDKAVDIDTEAYGMIAKLAAAPYQQKDDEKVGSFDCYTFFMDVEMMGMKGSTLYVDKKTGLLVQNAYGDVKGGQGFATVVTEFAQGGFGDEVFKVPAGITVSD